MTSTTVEASQIGSFSAQTNKDYKLVFATEENRFQKIAPQGRRNKKNDNHSRTASTDSSSTSASSSTTHSSKSSTSTHEEKVPKKEKQKIKFDFSNVIRPIAAVEVLRSLSDVPPLPPVVTDTTPDVWFHDYQKSKRLELMTKIELQETTKTCTPKTQDGPKKKQKSAAVFGLGSMISNAFGKIGTSLERASLDSQQKAELETRRRHNKDAVKRLEKYFPSKLSSQTKREDSSALMGAIIDAPFTFAGEDFICCFDTTLLSSEKKFPIRGQIYITSETLYFVGKGSFGKEERHKKGINTSSISLTNIQKADTKFHDPALYRLDGGTRATQPDAEEADLAALNLLHLLPLPLHSGCRTEVSDKSSRSKKAQKHQDPNTTHDSPLMSSGTSTSYFSSPPGLSVDVKTTEPKSPKGSYLVAESIPLSDILSYLVGTEHVVEDIAVSGWTTIEQTDAYAVDRTAVNLFVFTPSKSSENEAEAEGPTIRRLVFANFRHDLALLGRKVGQMGDGRPDVGYGARFVNYFDHAWQKQIKAVQSKRALLQ